MAEVITLVRHGDDRLTEGSAEWVYDSYTEPREALAQCCVCGQEIGEWYLYTCLDGGEAAHLRCVRIVPDPGVPAHA